MQNQVQTRSRMSMMAPESMLTFLSYLSRLEVRICGQNETEGGILGQNLSVEHFRVVVSTEHMEAARW